MIIMLMVLAGFILKLTYHGIAGQAVLCLLAAIFVALTADYAATQSKTQIADWLARPELMLDTSVWLTIDVAFQICFCVLMTRRLTGAGMSRKESVALAVTLWFPGLLIFPVLFSMLVEVIFSMPGTDFGLIGWGTAGCVLVIAPLLAWGVKALLPENDLRLELMFLLNLLTAALGIIATVNGRTAATGTNSVEWDALAGVFGLLVLGTITGIIINRYKLSKLK